MFQYRTEIEFYGQHCDWVMNSNPDPMERRSEVQFYDIFDLVGYGDSTVQKKGSYLRDTFELLFMIFYKLLTTVICLLHLLVSVDKDDDRNEMHEYLHDAAILIGMIIKTKPYYPEVDKGAPGPTIDGKCLQDHISFSYKKSAHYTSDNL